MTVDDYGRVDWRRRAEEDQWVVPHCADLLELADCHFHFDVVYTTKGDIGEEFSGDRRSLDIIENISQLANAMDFLLPPHILADPFACLERTFLSPRDAFVDEFNDFLLDTPSFHL
ncbi:hypothetical protein M405DRAFT_869004 [Rhizopogon salebrosus TDB-379]|nr:hypothetical protein M405DRAFT_869004 [Rhizopogon salebrosus TDB-379]